MAVTVVRRQPRLAGNVVAVSVAVAALAGLASGAIASLLLQSERVEVSRIAERAVLPSTTPYREQILAVESAGAVLPSTTPYRER
jgi:hypothetical protein